MIEVLVRERDQLREGAEMLIKKVERIRTCSDGDGSVDEGVFVGSKIFGNEQCGAQCLSELGEYRFLAKNLALLFPVLA